MVPNLSSTNEFGKADQHTVDCWSGVVHPAVRQWDLVITAMIAETAVINTKTRSTVKKPGLVLPGAVRLPNGPPTGSVMVRSKESLREGTTM
ncbi:hypothetical protein [Arthrobacter glacialis]|uniref:Uncharacterized protein n=1 Tax=Arthrobacter glacialis TaxID=1664 RepID=A0A2S3ZXI6_ARTGL|nr:hypothetical protein [Arthrobacter glacialis]POH59444.1 hypothetical protein CVS28_08260 [Arthrobacter glacialis]POH73789.1 hypothetical protein CVS27_07625 [Arthrobacter glacialis]